MPNESAEYLTLNDGTVLDGHCMEDDRNLFVYLDGKTIVEGVTLFSDPDRVRVITEYNHGTVNTYFGYTEIYSVSHEFGNCNLVMRRGGNNA